MSSAPSFIRGVADGINVGMGFQERRQGVRMREQHNARANEAHGMNMQLGKVRLDTALLDNEIKLNTAQILQTERGLKQLEMLANAYGATLGAMERGQSVPAEAKSQLIEGLNAILGPTVNKTGPADLEQSIADIEPAGDGFKVLLNNTDKTSGESYQAPMTTDRARGGRLPAIVPGEQMLGAFRTIFETAIQNGVDPRKISNAIRGGDEWTSKYNERGQHGQESAKSGKFVHSPLTGAEKAAQADAVGKVQTKNAINRAAGIESAKLNFRERNAGRLNALEAQKADAATARALARQRALASDKLAFEEENRERLDALATDKEARKLRAKTAVYEKYPELREAENKMASAKSAGKRQEYYDQATRDLYKKLGDSDDPDAKILVDNTLADLAALYGIEGNTSKRLTGGMLADIQAQAEAEVDDAEGLWSSEDDYAAFGDASTRDEAISFRAEELRAEHEQRLGMRGDDGDSLAMIEPEPTPAGDMSAPAAATVTAEPMSDGVAEAVDSASQAALGELSPEKQMIAAQMQERIAELEADGRQIDNRVMAAFVQRLRELDFTDDEINAMGLGE